MVSSSVVKMPLEAEALLVERGRAIVDGGRFILRVLVLERVQNCNRDHIRVLVLALARVFVRHDCTKW